MTPTLITAAILVAITAIGILSLRGFPVQVRIAFDAALFTAISIYLVRRDVSPVFAAPAGALDSAALWMRAIGGAWWVLGARLIVTAMSLSFRRNSRANQTTLFSDLSGAAIYIATALVVLNSVFALPVNGLLATSGVVAIVLGLALQNTLADVFAGMAVGVEAPFGVGDRIQIDEKLEGQVVQVNWRSIHIQTDGDDIAIIPNSHVAKAQIINRSFPGQRRAASVELSCPESAHPENVVETLQHATMLCPEIQRQPAPTVVLTRLGPKRNLYKISFFVANSAQLGPAQDALLRCSRRQLYYAGFLEATEQLTMNWTDDFSRGHRLLRDLVVLECLSNAEIEELAHSLKCRLLESGDILFKQGAVDATLYIVASGILEFTREVEGVPIETIGCVGAGEYVGEMGLLTGTSHAATATARTHCRIYYLPRDAVAALISKNPELTNAFERAAKHGADTLHRQVAVRAAGAAAMDNRLLPRIRSFFHFGSA
ncbi:MULTISPECIES: mechanosensitive ion channel family protein [unclassified Bradyrhizobium]|uniref:mechanosensitive ion channel family protein n=1 Tax=unclassified Bradyrhizobium TaxID=2631580 RepID=UPI0028EC92ED|nr:MULTISPECIES: mechanosensitive ion channel family protein [unclassified Bradyrhizobium]